MLSLLTFARYLFPSHILFSNLLHRLQSMDSALPKPQSGACFIDRLNNDTLYNIFNTGNEDAKCQQLLHESERIAQVSRRWRTLAEGSPRLWNYIIIDSYHKPARTGRWLALSGRANLTINWSWSLKESQKEMQSQAELLKPHAWRVRIFRLVTEGTQATEMVLNDFLPYLSASTTLRTLHLEATSQVRPSIQLKGHTFPALCELQLTNIDISWDWPRGILESLSIQHMCRYNLSWEEFFSILSESPNLNRLKLQGMETTQAWPSVIVGEREERLASLPRLQVLHLSFLLREQASLVLEHIRAPALSELVVTCHDMPDIAAAIATASSTLRSLTLRFAPRAESTVVSALSHALPCLEHITLFSNAWDGREVMDGSFFKAIDTCRALVSLRLRDFPLNGQHLISMVKRRRGIQGCSPIKRIEFENTLLWPRLRNRLVELGVQIINADDKGWSIREDDESS
ncbi:hypothetical protein FRB95_012844 [Tulasnella sp. JGI-2019a]|nr:hypothetical protein FRB95_012844 [Tulasnella sp. JGI-2019a]